MTEMSQLRDRWPHIARFLRVHESGSVDADFHVWDWRVDDRAERAAGYEEWAAFFEWRLLQRAEELAGDPHTRRLVETWTDSMIYSLRRSAAFARGEDPGEAIPQDVRRPDLAVRWTPADAPRCMAG